MTALAERLDAQTHAERRRAVRTLLRRPLLLADGEPDGHRLVQRHASWLKDWFAHETGWSLTVSRTVARLRKVPATHDDHTRAAAARPADPPFSRRRYVLLCLAAAVLESRERQTTLGDIADGVMSAVAADPAITDAGVRFDLDNRDQRRDLVAAIRLLIALGALRRDDGDEQAYVAGTGDALYTVERPVLAALLSVRRPPSTVAAHDLADRLAAVTAEPVPDTAEARNRTIRHHLTRRLVDDAVCYYADLDAGQLDYLTRQRHRVLTAVEAATGLIAEVRAEGIAMVDDRGDGTDVTMPDQGTDGHLTLLLAEHLAGRLRDSGDARTPLSALEARTAALCLEHASHWRNDVRDPGAEVQLTADAVARLEALSLIRRDETGIVALPAIARYRLEAAVEAPASTLLDTGVAPVATLLEGSS